MVERLLQRNLKELDDLSLSDEFRKDPQDGEIQEELCFRLENKWKDNFERKDQKERKNFLTELISAMVQVQHGLNTEPIGQVMAKLNLHSLGIGLRLKILVGKEIGQTDFQNVLEALTQHFPSLDKYLVAAFFCMKSGYPRLEQEKLVRILIAVKKSPSDLQTDPKLWI